MLLGGLVLATANRLERIPVPAGLYCALVHPHVVVETRRAREVLQGAYAIGEFVAQSAHLAQVLAACFRGDAEALRGTLEDVLVEPRRASLIPGFAAVKRAAMDAGALGAGISGAGPSVFAWCASRDGAFDVAQAMQQAFRNAGVEADTLVSPVDGPAAELLA
jgi:homoserine kinase